MARRNPTNERYGKHTGPVGKTRKSAASAKPKRSAGAGAGTSSGGKAPSKSNASVGIIHPPTPEYRKLRKVWWALLGAAIVFSSLAWWMWQTDDFKQYGTFVLGFAYACLGVSLWLDFKRLRPLRQEWVKSGGKLPKEKPAEKPDKSAGIHDSKVEVPGQSEAASTEDESAPTS